MNSNGEDKNAFSRAAEEDSRTVEIDIGQLLKFLLSKWQWIAAAIIVFAIAAFVCYQFLVTPMYTAKTLLYVDSRSTTESDSISSGEITAAKSLVDTYGVILKTRSTLEAAIEICGTSYTAEELQDMVTTEAVDDTEVFSVSVTCDDPQEAADIANAIGSVLPDKIPEVISGSSVSVVDEAVVPEEKSSPNVLKNTAMAAVIGLVIAAIALVLRYMLDSKVHDEDYVTRTYGLPLLAAIPDMDQPSKKGYGYGYGGDYETAYNRTKSKARKVQAK